MKLPELCICGSLLFLGAVMFLPGMSLDELNSGVPQAITIAIAATGISVAIIRYVKGKLSCDDDNTDSL
ncbi:hypothetical protein M0R72_12530 [Candidatus Pacearchaeota archaeon]|jgi:hypothetical protein|nr:hypothetical protein [Candidatus Pacearchaeota archaeon]